MAGSAADAISQAVERTQSLLFPFKAEKWFALGFTVFLAQCGEGGMGLQVPTWPSSGSSPFPRPAAGGGGSGGVRELLEDALRALDTDLALYVTLAVVGAVLGMGLWLFALWFSSRAKLMFVESAVWDRVDVGAQWARAAELGFSLFKFRALFSVGGGLLMLAALGAAAALALPDLRLEHFAGPRALAGYAVLAASLAFLALPVGVLLLLLDDFVVPLMVVRNTRVGEAWRAFRTHVLPGNVGGLVLFYLLRVALGLASLMVAYLVSCLSCCLTLVPYLGTVLLLPLSVFFRTYPLYYLEQLGVRVFPLPEPRWAAYEQWRFPG